MTESHEAACACGRLRIRLNGEPRFVSSCHCLACQRRTGSLFGASAFFGREQVDAKLGEDRIFERLGESGAQLAFHFCPNCGSTVWWESARIPDRVCVAIGAFADPGFSKPARTVWTKSKHSWLSFPDDIPHHPENPGP